MKVIHILNELKFSGAEIMYVSAATEFKKLGCELLVVNTAQNMGEYAEQFSEAGYQILHWPYKANGIRENIAYVREVITFLNTEKIDVVHIHRSSMRLLMSYCAWRAGCKSVYTFHNVFPTNWYSYVYHVGQRWLIKNVFGCKFQTISDSVYQHEKNFYFNNTCKIYNWYDNIRFFPATKIEKLEARKQLNIPEEAFVIISIGGCSHIKRHSDIIKAVSVIKEKYPNIIYLHLGEGDTLCEEQKQVKNDGLEQNVRFEGNQNDVRKFLIASDIYVMPSKHEGISVTTIEALATEIPSVLYDVPGLRDFNETLNTAKVIPENYKELAKTVVELYENREEREQLKKNGKEFVNKEFFMPVNARKIVELYQ
ncbi:glycosyltransferase family 4 protein [Zobellia roscoffensis]|uniref:glycosyltransferase family 4 protein n=1 Tax=Zobellia roscoffensis TaxID=2779508 RepID=UPI00188BCA2E|nr:glycosyltransferase family 4 protein [Zobellia roscoffensis]